jgi:hypothetical protein
LRIPAAAIAAGNSAQHNDVASQLSLGPGDRVGVDTGDNNAGAFGKKLLGCLQADTARTAGDESSFSIQT